MKTIFVLAVSLAVFVVSPTTASHLPDQPGIVSIRKDHGIALWHKEMVEERLNDTDIPDISGVLTTLTHGQLSLNLSNVVLKKFSDIKSKVNISKDEGIVATLTVPEIRLEGEIHLTIGSWLRETGITNFTVVLLGVTMTMERNITLLNDSLELVWKSSNVTTTIDSFDVELGDSRLNGWLLQVGELEKERFIIELLTKEWFIDHLTTFKRDMRLNLTDHLHMNLAVINQPKLLDGMIELDLVGKAEYEGDSEEFPEKPDDFDTFVLNNDRAIRISSTTLKSIGHFVHKHQMLSYKYTKDDLPKENKDLLNMDCTEHCFGTLFPKAKEVHPGSTAVISVATTDAPELKITPNSVVLEVDFTINVTAEKDGTEVGKLFTVHKSIASSVELSIRNNRLLFKLLDPKSNLTVIDSTIGNNLSEHNVDIVISQAFLKVIMPTISRMGVHGVDLKEYDYLLISHYDFLFRRGDLDILMDVDTTKEKDIASLPTIDLL